MKVKISLVETSQVIEHENVKNTYTKGPMFCVYEDGVVYKYPVNNIWRVTEDYGDSGRIENKHLKPYPFQPHAYFSVKQPPPPPTKDRFR